MSRRIDIELTSERPDGVWTWRAAGAKQPKGELDGGLLFSGAKVGDVVRADADFDIDGITVTAVLPPKGARPEPERIEVLGSPRTLEPVTTTLAKKGKGGRDDRRRGRDRDRDDRRDGKARGDRPDRGGRGRGDRPDREQRDRPPRGDGERRGRPARPPRPEAPAKPKPKRLKAGRTHRNAVLADLPPEQRPVAEQVLRGGIPAVRQAVQKQNEAAAAEGKPPVKAEPLVALAEQLLPRLRTAEWRDRAEAAKADLDELDLRDLRSVIVAADTGARDDESRALADELRTALNRRVEAEHAAWLAEIASTLAEGRCVRALRLSSRPPKAGAPLPTDMAARLAEATAASLTAEVTQDRWATVLDALAFSPVRLNVVPESLPANPSEALLTEIARLANQIPQIATVFGVEPASSGKRPRPRPPRGDRKPGRRVPPPPPKERADTAADASAAATGDDGADSGDATAPPPPAADAVGADPAAVTPDGTAAEDETAPEAPSGGPGAGAEAPDDGATEPAAAPDDAPDPGEGADATAADPTESSPPPPAPAASGATSSDAGPQDADTATGADDAAGADAEPTDA